MIRVETPTRNPDGSNSLEVRWLTDREAPVVWDEERTVLRPDEKVSAMRVEGSRDLIIDGKVYSS